MAITTLEYLYIEESGYNRALREHGLGGYGNKFEAALLAEQTENEPVQHHPACVKYGDDSGCDACNR